MGTAAQFGNLFTFFILRYIFAVRANWFSCNCNNCHYPRFFQRLPEAGSPNVVVFDSDMLESVIAVARDAKVEIYTFDSKEGLFQIYQSVTIPNPCRQLFSFTLSYQHYIGCIPQEENSPVLFIYYNYNTNEYGLDGNTFGNITAVEIYPVAVADYRDEYLLIVQDSEGLTHIMTYHGLQIGFQVEYTCNSEGTSRFILFFYPSILYLKKIFSCVCMH